MSSIVDYKNLIINSCNDMNTAVTLGMIPHLECKRMQAKVLRSRSITETEKGVSRDRFIQNRAAMDID